MIAQTDPDTGRRATVYVPHDQKRPMAAKQMPGEVIGQMHLLT